MSIKALITIVVSCSLVILATLGCTTEEEVEGEIEREATSATIIRITALDLIAEYEANEIAADQKYEGTILDITGTIDDFGEDILGRNTSHYQTAQTSLSQTSNASSAINT